MKRRSKRHAELCDALLERYPALKIQEELHLGGGLFLDVFLPNLRIGVEVDGIQHDVYHSFFHKDESDFNRQKLNDTNKELWCMEQSIFLYRIKHFDKRDIDDIIDDILESANAFMKSSTGPREDNIEEIRKGKDDSNASKYPRRKYNSRSFRSRYN